MTDFRPIEAHIRRHGLQRSVVIAETLAEWLAKPFQRPDRGRPVTAGPALRPAKVAPA